ncbi:MAG: hypothetical protein PVJ75_17440 [Chloroflexota bacterium]|jgi:hypothetical protein
MTVAYTNRKGKTYYLHVGKTKLGNPKYFFAQRDKGNLVKAVPPGYEIYENPNSQVFLRKIKPQIITDEEVAVVKAGMQQYCHLKHFIVDVKKNAIVIYTPDQNVESLSDLFSSLAGSRQSRVDAALARVLSYSPMLQFVLIDEVNRVFETQRYCFLGSIDDWIIIGDKDTLPRLVKTYVRHLGEESFYDLY